MASVIDQLFSSNIFTNFEKFVQNVMAATDTVRNMEKEVSALVGQLGSLKSMADAQQFLGRMQQAESRMAAAEAARAEALKLLAAEQEKMNRLSRSLEESGKRIAAMERQLAALTERKTAATRNLSAEQKAAAAQSRAYEGIAVNEARAVKALDDSYEQLNAQLNALRGTYRTLSAEGRNSPFGKQMLADINDMDAQLKKIDADMGLHGRHVGNYSGAIAGLNMNLTQVVRELPNVSLGLNTFILSLSNNIPMLTDSINRLREANKAAAAQGQATVPVWRTLAKGLGTWGTVITIAVTLLVAFSGKISEWVKGLKKGSDATDAARVAQEQFNQALSEGAKNASGETARLDVLYRASQDVSRSMGERNDAIDELQRKYPEYFGNLTNEEIMLGKAAVSYEKLKNAILAKAKAEAFSNEIGENSIKIYNLEQERINKYVAVISKARYYIKQGHDDVLLPFEGSSKQAKDIVEGYDELTKKINDLKDANKNLESNIDISALLENFSGADTDLPAKIVENLKEAVEKIKAEIPDIEFSSDLDIDGINKQIRSVSEISKDRERELNTAHNNELIALEQAYRDQLLYADEYERKKLEIQKNYADQETQYQIEKLKELQEQYRNEDNYAGVLLTVREIYSLELKAAEDASKAELKVEEDKTNKLLELKEKYKQAVVQTWNDISSSVGQIAAGMSERRMQEIEQESKLAELESERVQKSIDDEQKRLDNAIMTDEQRALHQEMLDAKQEAAEEKKRLKDAQIEQKRRMEEVRMARFEKTRALMEANVATAVSIANSAKIGFPLAIPFIIMASVAGAAQTAAILAQPLPKYAKGGRDIPAGLAVVGDGGRNEIYESPLGRLMMTPKIPTLINAEKGANIYPDMTSFIKSQFSEISRFRESKAPDGGLTDRHVDRIIGALKSRENGGVHVNMTRHGTLDVWIRNQKRLKVLGNELFI